MVFRGLCGSGGGERQQEMIGGVCVCVGSCHIWRVLIMMTKRNSGRRDGSVTASGGEMDNEAARSMASGGPW